MNALEQPPQFIPIGESDCTINFSRDGKLVGVFDFSQSPATFTGDVDASARLFVELVIATFNKAVPQ